MVREKGLDCSRSNFNYYILKHEKFAEYFKPNKKKDAVKSETSFGKQAQFDWKEKLKFSFKSGEEFIFNVGSLILSASRFKYWAICPSTSQAYLFDFLTNVFEALGGVPKEIVIDNASTMMDKARTERSDGKVNPKFQQFADDFGFNIEIAAEPKMDTYVFPWILNGATSAKDIRSRTSQENSNVKDRVTRICKEVLGWEIEVSGTWCRHSFATNLRNAGVDMNYISESMGHSMQDHSVTQLYIEHYPLKKQMEYNSLLLNIGGKKKNTKEELISQLSSLSAEELQKLLAMAKM